MLWVTAGRVVACPRQIVSLGIAVLCVFLVMAAAPARAIDSNRPAVYHAAILNGAVTGSAFAISEGIAVTNAHVLNGRGPGEFIHLLIPGKPRIAARIMAVSTRIDLALVALSEGSMPVVPSAPGRDRRGQTVFAVGVIAANGAPRQQKMVSGTVSSDLRTIRPFGRGVIAHMPGIRRGFSGGPVFDQQGRFVGMVAALRAGSAGNPRTREVFILSAEDVRRETNRLLRTAELIPAALTR